MSEYKYILIPLIAVFLSQIIKTVYEAYLYKRFDIKRFFNGSGGMPSSHSTLVTSLLTVIVLNDGFTSKYFAIALVFSIIVLYDAMGVRYESGKQAEVLNQITQKINIKEIAHLKERLGHKPIEVLGGIIAGITFALIFNKFI